MVKRNYPSDYRPEYDKGIIREFREKQPNVVNDMRMNIKHLRPDASDELVESLIDKEILPPVLESGTQNNMAFHFGVLNDLDKVEYVHLYEEDTSYRDFISDKVEAVIVTFEEKDQVIIKMWGGLHPHERPHKQREIAEHLGMKIPTVSYRINTLIQKLAKEIKKHHEEYMRNLEYCW